MNIKHFRTSILLNFSSYHHIKYRAATITTFIRFVFNWYYWQRSNARQVLSTPCVYSAVQQIIIGARFEPAKKRWSWSDGTTAGFDTSNLLTCKQKFLDYVDGSKLNNANCSGELAPYACQVKRELRVEIWERKQWLNFLLQYWLTKLLTTLLTTLAWND